MKRALVTGGAGFIGSHMVDHLIASYHVYIIDNLITGEEKFIHPKATFYEEDVRNKDQINTIIQKVKPDVVFHIAGQASNINSFSDPHFDIDVNFKGTVNVVLAALAAQVPRFLYASSMTVYGHPDVLPVSENQPCRPVSYYGISKYAAERFVHATAARSDLLHPFHATSFRMFNVYGPRQSLTNAYQGALAIFIGNVLRNESISIFGDGKQTRDFIFVHDVVRAWINSIENNRSYNTVYNLGFGSQIDVNTMARTVIKAAGKNPETYPIIHKEHRPGEQRFMQADISKIKQDSGFLPETTFEEGLRQTIKWSTASSHHPLE